jgi:hypothetical protein
MRMLALAVAAVLVVAARADADAPVSPRLAALAAQVAAKQRGAEDAFWNQVAGEGTPLVEDTRDPKGRLLVTFVYRAKPDTRAVAMYAAPGGIYSYAQLARLAGTGVFAYSALVDPSARFSYVLAPGDDLGPPGGGIEDIGRRVPLFRPDPLPARAPVGRRARSGRRDRHRFGGIRTSTRWIRVTFRTANSFMTVGSPGRLKIAVNMRVAVPSDGEATPDPHTSEVTQCIGTRSAARAFSVSSVSARSGWPCAAGPRLQRWPAPAAQGRSRGRTPDRHRARDPGDDERTDDRR